MAVLVCFAIDSSGDGGSGDWRRWKLVDLYSPR